MLSVKSQQRKINNMPEFSKIPNIVIIFETVQTALAEDVHKAFDNMDETWRETKETLNNFRIATKDALRVRGDSARKIEIAEIWKQVGTTLDRTPV